MSRKPPKPANVVSRILLAMLAVYKRLASPLLGTRCRFYPSCSDYARQAIQRHGALRGVVLAAWRLLRCQPLSDGGVDPVPDSFQLVGWPFHRARHQARHRDVPHGDE